MGDLDGSPKPPLPGFGRDLVPFDFEGTPNPLDTPPAGKGTRRG